MDEGSHPLMHAALSTLVLCSFAAFAPGQGPAKLIEALGDPAQGEAAEVALVELGSQANKPLDDLFTAWDVSSDRAKRRLLAALRVTSLLGESAAPLTESLAPRAGTFDETLSPALLEALGSLMPYATIKDESNLQCTGSNPDGSPEEEASFRAWTRLLLRKQTRVDELGASLALLERDQVCEREVAAEVLGRLGMADGIKPLRNRLRQRDRTAKGADSLRHNGFPLPFPDRFRLRAGMALARLGPTDGRCAIGFGCIALLHPHHSVRLAALQRLASFGPDCADAVPELLQIAEGSDAPLAREALKDLGMAGACVGPMLRRIEALQARPDPAVQRLAKALAARLRAMGVVPSDPPAEDARLDRLRQVAAGITDDSKDFAAARTELLAAPDVAFELLRARHWREQRKLPQRALHLLGELTRPRGAEDREALRRILAIPLQNSSWESDGYGCYMMASNAKVAEPRLYAEMVIGVPATLPEWLPHLESDSSAVRHVAACDLAARHREVAKAENAAVQTALLDAAKSTHPKTSTFGDLTKMNLDLTEEIQAAAAAAMVDCELTTEQTKELLPKLLHHDDAQLVSLGIARWASRESLDILDQAAKDTRPEVRQAAEAALARLREGK